MGIVDGINDEGRRDLPSAEETAVETFDSIFATFDLVKLDVNIALAVGINGDVIDFAIFSIAFSFDIFFQLLCPILAFLSNRDVSLIRRFKKYKDLLVWIKHIL